MIEATLTLAALIPLAGYAGWRVGRSWPQPHPNADDYRNRAERAEAALAEALADVSAARSYGDDMLGRAFELSYAVEKAEAENIELRAELAKYKPRRNAKGRFVRREP